MSSLRIQIASYMSDEPSPAPQRIQCLALPSFHTSSLSSVLCEAPGIEIPGLTMDGLTLGLGTEETHFKTLMLMYLISNFLNKIWEILCLM